MNNFSVKLIISTKNAKTRQ